MKRLNNIKQGIMESTIQSLLIAVASVTWLLARQSMRASSARNAYEVITNKRTSVPFSLFAEVNVRRIGHAFHTTSDHEVPLTSLQVLRS